MWNILFSDSECPVLKVREVPILPSDRLHRREKERRRERASIKLRRNRGFGFL